MESAKEQIEDNAFDALLNAINSDPDMETALELRPEHEENVPEVNGVQEEDVPDGEVFFRSVELGREIVEEIAAGIKQEPDDDPIFDEDTLDVDDLPANVEEMEMELEENEHPEEHHFNVVRPNGEIAEKIDEKEDEEVNEEEDENHDVIEPFLYEEEEEIDEAIEEEEAAPPDNYNIFFNEDAMDAFDHQI
ncbi:PREDICTED: X-linked retinitis pigmentosa GTPase regulator-interacting protein 1-like [Nicrophorus vespilloides]|uniref:X-linked retinitis pigmentosa GTPase regulator-interacting protein 1-like n=1 Tax=Nicrophorus vespilloides TaxID=110193 RepID=A0ABM1MA61_NICVS|nr:PREDICTED: X-linked retinitis pigmentosa GTPase regulator-interacting protein 1-like [Nicrophorus vespilloides]